MGLASSILAGCATPDAARQALPPAGGDARLQAALQDLELHQPRLTEVERATLHQRQGFRYSVKEHAAGSVGYSIEWTAKDHMVDVSGTGSLKDVTRAEVRRFALNR